MSPSTSSDANDRTSARLLTLLAIAAAFFSVCFAGFAAWDQDWTTDEHVHLDWSERFWSTGAIERDSVARFDSKTPIHVPNILTRHLAERAGFTDEQALRFAARLPQLLWLALLLFATGAMGRELGGPSVGRVSVVLASLDPNLTAHASVATSDVPLAACTALTLSAALAQRRRPAVHHAALFGGLMGLALVAKFSAVLLVPLAMAVAFLRKSERWKDRGVQIGICAFCAWLVVVAAYGGQDVFSPLKASTWKSEAFRSLAERAPDLPVPLPRGFLEGVDRSRARDAEAAPIVTILGYVGRAPVWYYFLAAWALKTPIALIVGLLASLPWLAKSAMRRPDLAGLLAHQAVNLLFFSIAFRTQLGYRYVLMLIPVTSALMAAAAFSLGPRIAIRLVMVGAVLVVSESARFWGDPLAFSNVVVRPKEEAYRFLGNSDIDWNQNRERWVEARREKGLPDNGALDPVDLVAGLNVISTSQLAGVYPGDRFRWAREHLTPYAMAGFTHHYFDVTEEDYSRFLDEARHLPPSGDERCGMSATGAMDPPGQGHLFESDRPPQGPRVSLLCVATRKGADLAAQVSEGRMDFVPLARPDLGGYMPAGQALRFRLEPGVHLFLITETPYRRASLPYRLVATFSAMGRGAILKIIPGDLKDLPRTTPEDDPKQ